MHEKSNVQLTKIYIKNFRCFPALNLELDSPLVLVEGINGSGKTSLLEALHYACYLRSFRTHVPRDLIRFGQQDFFIKVALDSRALDHAMHHEVQVGFSGKRRLVKVDQKSVCSYKELMDYYRVVTLTEDDLSLINGGPDARRSFIDQAILLNDPSFITVIRNFRQVLESRNALLQISSKNEESYMVWTRQLWEKSLEIQERRKMLLKAFEQEIAAMIHAYLAGHISIRLTYMAKKMGRDQEGSFEEFWSRSKDLFSEEARYGRSLFGAHLDDFAIEFQEKKSRSFASRGQQKLLSLLIKIAQIKHVSSHIGSPIFLLDDFMTDFDAGRAESLLGILFGLRNQLIFTTPIHSGFFEEKLIKQGGSTIKLTG